MDVLQWAITTAVGILGILVGRAWQRRDKNNQKDKEILDEITKLLDKDTISYCRQQNFTGAFDWDRLVGLNKFIEACEHSSFYFLDKRLEKLRKQLLETATGFYRELSLNSFREDQVDSRWARIPKDREFGNEKEYYSLERKLNNLANELVKNFDDLVKLGRQKL
ncbi:MAG: hypothetical protein HS124_11170 [Anaerolineales bacterium]|nr:hypothetical protein [Anaerolineales bacterium]MCL4260343.1 hypothetical protein [Anaerolineales bacterium]